jgi:4-aminobutyrate aminotransferase-like enzyme
MYQLSNLSHRTLSLKASQRISESNILIASSRSGLEAGNKIKKYGGIFVCDRGSTHIEFQNEILKDEYKNLKLPYHPISNESIHRECEEYSLSDFIAVPSTCVLNSFLKKGINKNKLFLNPYGVNLETFSPQPKIKSEDFIVIYVGQLSVRKGIFYLLEAFKKLKIKIGDKIKKGSKIGVLGNSDENGNWTPHLHFQLMLSLLNFKNDFPGVCYYSEKSVWGSICPDPNKIFKTKALNKNHEDSNELLIKMREKYLGKNLSLSYNKPIKIVRGKGQYLINDHGRKYLDTVNNIAHVGHENENVVKAGQKQMSILNTNTRYLHPNLIRLSEEILKTFPKKLSTIYYVNSGSEANELAIRLMKNYTGQNDIIVFEGGYHGSTNSTVEISSYKYMGKGGGGESKHVHSIPMPDVFRGKYTGLESSKEYVNEVAKKVDKIKSKGKSIAGMIIEPIISCGGQIELPNNFLKNTYKIIKKNKGLLISDEIQTGFGRVGEKFWGFQLHDVIPDIVTLGKPMGNGHPIGAVVCTKEIDDKFNNGMEFFSSFGGNPVSCAIAISVLDEVKKNNLQKNAKVVGNYIKSELKKVSKKFPIISNVRGKGLFLGFELTSNKLNPLPDQTNYLVNRMKEYGILMSSDGIDKNVIKIKPPLVFNKDNTDTLIYFLRKVLKEDPMKVKS